MKQIKPITGGVAATISSFFPGKPAAFASPSLELCNNLNIATALGQSPMLCLPYQPMRCETIVGWGRRSGLLAERMARRRGSKLLLLEDGFLRSFNRHDPSCSVVIDDLGIYFDAHGPSRLERLIDSGLNAEQTARILHVLDRWRALKLSKYNAGNEYQGELPENFVLVVDQVRHDASIRFGMADERSFKQMLDAAVAENPHADIVVKVHPDVFTRAKSGHYDVEAISKNARIHVIAENCLPSHLIEKAVKIYTVTSQIGFEALIWQKPVRCFGMPFYAGWGVSEDDLPAPERRAKVPFLQLAMAALITYPCYVDVSRGAPCEIEMIIDYLAELKQKA